MERASWGAPPSCLVAARPSRMRADLTRDSGRLMPAEKSMLLAGAAACTPPIGHCQPSAETLVVSSQAAYLCSPSECASIIRSDVSACIIGACGLQHLRGRAGIGRLVRHRAGALQRVVVGGMHAREGAPVQRRGAARRVGALSQGALP